MTVDEDISMDDPRTTDSPPTNDEVHRGLNQHMPVTRADALKQAHKALMAFNANNASDFIKHGSQTMITVENWKHMVEKELKPIQKAEAKFEKLQLDYLYAEYFQKVTTIPPPAHPTEAALQEIARLLNNDPIPSHAQYTAERRKMVTNAIHDAEEEFYKKYVKPEDLAAFHDKRAAILRGTKGEFVVRNKQNRWTVKPLDKNAPAQSVRTAQSIGKARKQENAKKAKDAAANRAALDAAVDDANGANGANGIN